MTFKKMNRIVTVVFAIPPVILQSLGHPFLSYCFAGALIGWMWPSNWENEGYKIEEGL